MQADIPLRVYLTVPDLATASSLHMATTAINDAATCLGLLVSSGNLTAIDMAPLDTMLQSYPSPAHYPEVLSANVSLLPLDESSGFVAAQCPNMNNTETSLTAMTQAASFELQEAVRQLPELSSALGVCFFSSALFLNSYFAQSCMTSQCVSADASCLCTGASCMTNLHFFVWIFLWLWPAPQNLHSHSSNFHVTKSTWCSHTEMAAVQVSDILVMCYTCTHGFLRIMQWLNASRIQPEFSSCRH